MKSAFVPTTRGDSDRSVPKIRLNRRSTGEWGTITGSDAIVFPPAEMPDVNVASAPGERRRLRSSCRAWSLPERRRRSLGNADLIPICPWRGLPRKLRGVLESSREKTKPTARSDRSPCARSLEDHVPARDPRRPDRQRSAGKRRPSPRQPRAFELETELSRRARRRSRRRTDRNSCEDHLGFRGLAPARRYRSDPDVACEDCMPSRKLRANEPTPLFFTRCPSTDLAAAQRRLSRKVEPKLSISARDRDSSGPAPR